MPDDPYSLGDLSRLADVTPRTVRYYVAQGLLPAPEAAGPNTRYGEGHLARLRLIRRLQRDHLPLAEIRARLERMGEAEVVAAMAATEATEPEPSQDAGDTLAFVRSLMRDAGVRPTVSGSPPPRPTPARHTTAHDTLAAPDLAVAEARPGPAAFPAVSEALPAVSAALPAEPGAPGPSTVIPPSRSTWERLVIAPDVELHVRRPLDRLTNRRVDQLERIAREIFEDT